MNIELEKLFVERMQQCNTGDWEMDHSNADDLLLEFLRELGYTKLADAWDKNPRVKWYA